MAKKVVASLKREASEQEKIVKVIRAKRSEKQALIPLGKSMLQPIRSRIFSPSNFLKSSRKGFPKRKAFFVRYGIF